MKRKLRGYAWKIQRQGAFMVFFLFLGLCMLAFIALPVVSMIGQETSETLVKALMDPEVRGAIFTTLYTATIATLMAFSFGVPLAYVLARFDFPGKALVDSIIDLPILIPHTVAGIALLTLFGIHGPVGQVALPFGVKFTYTIIGIIIAQLFVSAPFLIKTAREAFESIDPNLEKVARTLGASRFKAFLKVTFPLASSGIVTGCILTWARAISEFGAVIIIAYYPTTAPVLIYKRFLSEGLAGARSIAVLLILVTFLAFVSLKILRLKPLRRFFTYG
jgi:molybdate/tungstate transport system permease protein